MDFMHAFHNPCFRFSITTLYNPYNHSYQTQLEVDLVKKSNPGLHGLTRVNLEKLKKNWDFNISYEKLKNNPREYELYIL